MVSARLPLRTTTTFLRSGTLVRSRNPLALARNSSPSRPSRSIHPTISLRIVGLGRTPTLHMMVTIRRPHLSRWILPLLARLPHHLGTMSIRPITPFGRTVPPRRMDFLAAAYRTLLSLLSFLPLPKRCIAPTDSSIVPPNITPKVVW